MKVKINGKKIEVPHSGLLTVNQYCDLMEFEQITIIEYLAYFTDYSVEQIKFSKIDVSQIQRLSHAIGFVKTFDSFMTIKKLPDEIYFDGEMYSYNKLNDLTGSVGARLLLAQFSKREKIRKLDPVIYLLAIILSGTFDVEATNRKFEDLQKANYVDAFKIAAFFFQKFKTQSVKGMNFLERLKLKIQILILAFGKRLV